MELLYYLVFYTYPNGDYREQFGIGVFRTWEEAMSVEQRYRREVPGFRDYACESEIKPISVIGTGSGDRVYRFVDWNVNEDFDEVDILESDFYWDVEQADAAFQKMQKSNPREDMALERWVIGRCYWEDGFVRVACE